MSKVVISRSVFEMLVKHLVDVEDEKDRIIIEFYPNFTKERDSFQKLISDYISGIESRIYNIETNEGGDAVESGLPFVIIGSRVEVENLTYNEAEAFQIISPFTNESSINWDCASYLSPLGKEMLLKSIGDEVKIDTPAGKVIYKIKNIKLT
jgi:transcription elongation factor GreA